jgi:hypothetical protein
MLELISLIKIQETSRCLYVCNSDTHGLKGGRPVAVRWKNATRRRSNSVKRASSLSHEQKGAAFSHPFLRSEEMKHIEIHRRIEVQYSDACLPLQQVYEWSRKF